MSQEKTLSEAIAAVPDRRLRRYLSMVETHLRKTDKLVVIHQNNRDDQEVLDRWLRYFDDHVGIRPRALTMFLNHEAKYHTVPTADPMDFDRSYGTEQPQKSRAYMTMEELKADNERQR